MANSADTPDISALLRSLTAYLPQSAPATGAKDQTQRQLPVQSDHQHTVSAAHPQQLASHKRTLPPRQPYNAANEAAVQLHTDPREIRMWPLALKYTSLLLAHYPDLAARIKHMIKNQHENEQAWWAGRQALIRQQAARENGQSQVNELLRSIGGVASNDNETPDHELELKNYEKKVYTAMKQMVHSMSVELAKEARTNYDPTDLYGDVQVLSGNEAYNKGKMSIKELRRLQNLMLQFLEDYSKD